jgi:hypothetical protein
MTTASLSRCLVFAGSTVRLAGSASFVSVSHLGAMLFTLSPLGGGRCIGGGSRAGMSFGLPAMGAPVGAGRAAGLAAGAGSVDGVEDGHPVRLSPKNPRHSHL